MYKGVVHMSISLFEIIGPIMVGPSSSHTAGMVRIGLTAYNIIGRTIPNKITITLHDTISNTYKGHRTDVALVAGVLGISEQDRELKNAIIIAKKKSIEIDIAFFTEGEQNPNTVMLEITMPDGNHHSIKGVSVGGGSIRIVQIDGVTLKLSPKTWNIVVWSHKNVSHILAHILAMDCKQQIEWGECDDSFVTVIPLEQEPNTGIVSQIKAIKGVVECRCIAPIMEFGRIRTHKSLLNSFEELCSISEKTGKSLATLALEYEQIISGESTKHIEGCMQNMLNVMKKAACKGLTAKNKLIYGLTSGKDAKLLMEAEKKGKTISGGIVPRAVAYALSVMEVNASMGVIVAAPTAGSSGIVPGCLLAMQEAYELTDQQLGEALLVCAITGAIIAERGVSLSGVVGGCQGEIGVSSAIAAAGMTAVFGGTPRQITNAMAMSIKNLLGLICDPIGGPIEVPCIKRNAVGVANAFVTADMALSGIISYIPPDEVVDALVNTQKLLPPELRGSVIGGLASTCTAKAFRDSIEKKGLEE